MEYHLQYFHFWELVDSGTCVGFKDRGDEIFSSTFTAIYYINPINTLAVADILKFDVFFL